MAFTTIAIENRFSNPNLSRLIGGGRHDVIFWRQYYNLEHAVSCY